MSIIEQLAAFSTMEPAALARLTVSPDGSTGNQDADIILSQLFAILVPLSWPERAEEVRRWMRDQAAITDDLLAARRRGQGDEAGIKAHMLVYGQLKLWDIAIFRHTGGSSELHFDARVA